MLEIWQYVLQLSCVCNIVLYCTSQNTFDDLCGQKVVDNSDVVGASPGGAAPNTSSFLT